MEITEKTRRELERRVDELEDFIAKKGIGSEYLQRAERAQRDLNLALLFGSAAVALGVAAWTVYKFRDGEG
ncbi:hypothetical protein [Rhodohalobacter mucosus]|uniref:Uncharacterized protein n=1 Tax=Rhodohalobacter mucosus TaxID=2079485 RepID=A0A316TVJ8_9BACT|nr:hypothetical protein [Rhodohalobacter mucosus]PWN06494.1 hypothetical protein DDZ15_08200 [Rhodohalobacter mucosus]